MYDILFQGRYGIDMLGARFPTYEICNTILEYYIAWGADKNYTKDAVCILVGA